jgi:predicted benzoate:H+ symporter BenE
LYRPLPYESHSPQEMVTAVEGVVLIAFTLRALRRSYRAIRLGRQLPYVMYCLGALIVFIVAFSGFSNFGILARERSVIQPLFLVFLSLPKDVGELLPEASRAGNPGVAEDPRRALT